MSVLHSFIYRNYLRIRDGDLWVADTANPSIGLHYVGLDKLSVFICLPREASLGIMNNGRSLCMAMRTCALTTTITIKGYTQPSFHRGWQ